ncbi:uncharacterized protein LOC9657871 [Selaginella moellendorffii]|nr:uncharacterized protein LOC9657871 [Selaginella moellendorffii]|eukprot:XP_002962047.2 uncharacterized protein LOC9657871 [Selaginella moellendorffii]
MGSGSALTGIGNSGSSGPSRATQGFGTGVPREDMRIQQQQEQQQQQQHQKIPSAPVAILWDIENCTVPGEVNPEEVAGNVRMALRMHSSTRGAVKMFSAYGDFNHFPRKVREGCQRTGVNLIDVPNGRKNASDKAILVDMFLFALDNRPPCTILLITGDVDFAPALHKLGQRDYTVVLAIPSGYVSGSLCSAGKYVWDWTSVARGHGLVPARPFQPRESVDRRFPVMFSDESGDETGRGATGLSPPIPVPQPRYVRREGSGEWGLMQQQQQQERHSPQQMSPSPQWTQINVRTTSQPSTSSALPVEPEDPGSPSFVQPGDISGLKRQLVKLLSLHGGKMLMLKIPSKYIKLYQKPLYMADYGSRRLVHLIERMQDTVCIKGKGSQRKVHLTAMGKRMAARYKEVWGSACEGKNDEDDDEEDDDDERENEVEEQEIEAPKEESKSMVDEEVVVYVSKLDVSQDSSDSPDERGSEQHREVEEVIEIQEVVESSGSGGGGSELAREAFKRELQELLVSFQYHILVSDLLRIYRQRYSKDPDYAAFGVQDLEGLLDKVKDVAVLKGRTRDKMVLVANVGFVETED